MIELTVNRKKRRYRGPAFKRLLDVLREDFELTGTKEGCGEGECGACTVILDGEPVNSCLIPVAQAEGSRVLTVEGLAAPSRLSPLQHSFLDRGAAQCGICTPGMLMTAVAHLRGGGGTDTEAVRVALAGNLCRCTGYQHIVAAVVETAKRERKRRSRAR